MADSIKTIIEVVPNLIEGSKRQYFPCIVKSVCPNCGKEVVRDLQDHYLSYPVFGEECELDFYCYDDEGEGCEHEWSVMVIPRLTLELCEEGE